MEKHLRFDPSAVLIGCALRQETAALRRRMRRRWRIVTTGFGAARTAAFLESALPKSRPSLFLFTGTAGQLAPDLGMGEVALPASWMFEDGRRFQAHAETLKRLDAVRFPACASGLTVAKPVMRAATRERLHRESGALLCDMESAAALQIAERFEVPCLAPKVISDTAESGVAGFWLHFGANLEKLARYMDRVLDELAPAAEPDGDSPD